MEFLDVSSVSERRLAGAAAVREAARAADRPDRLPETVSAYRGRLRHGYDGDASVLAVALDGERVTGVAEVELPTWDNTHAAYVDVTVDPRLRRRGIGRSLFRASLEWVRARDRTLVVGESGDLPAAVAFAKAMGMELASEGVERTQLMSTVDRIRLDEVFAGALGHAADYELVRLPGAVPEDLLGEVARMTAAINDAPLDDLDLGDEVYTPERIRAFEAAHHARGFRLYRVVARLRSTGEFAGHTLVAVVAEQPWYCWQLDTSVLRAHRGHRLGLLLKIDMLRWLAAVEPQLERIVTDNAASNAHMIAVNELLGQRVTGALLGWQCHLA